MKTGVIKLKYRIISTAALCAAFLAMALAGGAWARSFWDSATGILVIDDPLPVVTWSGEEIPRYPGGIEQLLRGNETSVPPVPVPDGLKNFTYPGDMKNVKSLIVTPQAARGGGDGSPAYAYRGYNYTPTSGNTGFITREDFLFLLHGDDRTATSLAKGMSNVTRIDLAGALMVNDGSIPTEFGGKLSNLSFISLPEGLKELQERALFGNLEEIVLPSTLATVGPDSLGTQSGGGLTAIFLGQTAPAGYDTASLSGAEVYVPKESSGYPEGVKILADPVITLFELAPGTQNLSNAGGEVTVTIHGENLWGLKILLDSDHTAPIYAAVHRSLAEAYVVLPPNNTAEPAVHTLTALVGDLAQALEVTVPPEPRIVSFMLAGATGEIDETASPKTIQVTVPFGTDLRSLMPEIEHTGNEIRPQMTEARNFTRPVNYTVIVSDDAPITTYRVYANVALDSSKSITDFYLAGKKAAIQGNEIFVTVPASTDITHIAPVIYYEGVHVRPVLGEPVDFSKLVEYTVTAADTTSRHYIVQVTLESEGGGEEPSQGGGGCDTGTAVALLASFPLAALLRKRLRQQRKE